jgi:hypothetical protein
LSSVGSRPSPISAILWISAALSGLGTGYIVGATQPFTGAFLVAGVVLVVGIVAYVFILGRREPIADPPAA